MFLREVKCIVLRVYRQCLLEVGLAASVGLMLTPGLRRKLPIAEA